MNIIIPFSYRKLKDRIKIIKFKNLLLVLSVLLFAAESSAQISVEAHLDSAKILIGSQTRLTIEVKAPYNAKINYPSLRAQQILKGGLEIVSIDTTDNRFQRNYILTGWEKRHYKVPSLTVYVNGKKYKTEEIPLEVKTISVDTKHPDNIKPAYGVVNNIFSWGDWSDCFWLSILALLLLALAYYLYIRLKYHKPIISHIQFIKKKLPHQVALAKIAKLKHTPLNNHEEQKVYYTLLTDILREYLFKRFAINAKEMTSSQILSNLQKIDPKGNEELRAVFETSDLVKFAKYTVHEGNDENKYLGCVINFIQKTKQENQPTVEKNPNSLAKSKAKERYEVIFLIALFLTIAIAIFVYVTWNILELSQWI